VVHMRDGEIVEDVRQTPSAFAGSEV
jgi:hypothetical protein